MDSKVTTVVDYRREQKMDAVGEAGAGEEKPGETPWLDEDWGI